jgi:hypothetical protein
MSKRQKYLKFKTFNFDAILTCEAAHSSLPVAIWNFFGICRVLHRSKSDGGPFGVWDFSVSSFVIGRPVDIRAPLRIKM